jgi:adenosine deaminase
MRDLIALPKAELHIHLEGSIRVDTLRELAGRRGASVSSALGPDGSWSFAGHEQFIERYGEVCDLLHDLDEFRRIALELIQDLASQGVRYAEVVFSPAQHAGRLGDAYGPIEAVLDGFAAGERETGVVARLAPDVIRDFGLQRAEETLEVALRYVDRGVVSLNCAGSERGAIAPYSDIFRRAVEGGLHSTPHAGEWSPPANVWETLEYLRPERIGHGVRSFEDPRLVERLAELRLPLEICPTSNVATGVYATLEEHPFPRLRDAGVVVTINSDDPAMFGSWVSDEYRVAREVFGYGDEDLAELARAGVCASFADGDVKAAILSDIDAWLGAAEPGERATA